MVSDKKLEVHRVHNFLHRLLYHSFFFQRTLAFFYFFILFITYDISLLQNVAKYRDNKLTPKEIFFTLNSPSILSFFFFLTLSCYKKQALKWRVSYLTLVHRLSIVYVWNVCTSSFFQIEDMLLNDIFFQATISRVQLLLDCEHNFFCFWQMIINILLNAKCLSLPVHFIVKIPWFQRSRSAVKNFPKTWNSQFLITMWRFISPPIPLTAFVSRFFDSILGEYYIEFYESLRFVTPIIW